MTLRVCLVTPYAWDRPHEGNDHVAALASHLTRAGHVVVVLAPASRPVSLRDGRARLRLLERGVSSALEPTPGTPLVFTVGQPGRGIPTLPSVAAAVRRVLHDGAFDIVEALDPDLPGPSAAALRDSPTPVMATFSRTTARRPITAKAAERIAARAAVATALSQAAATSTRERLGIETTVLGPMLPNATTPRERVRTVVVECPLADPSLIRPLLAEVALHTAAVRLARSSALAAPALRALVPAGASSVQIVDAAGGAARDAALDGATIYVAHPRGSMIAALHAAAAGAVVVAVRDTAPAEHVTHERDGLLVAQGQPALLAASVGRLLANDALRHALSTAGVTRAGERAATTSAAREEAYRDLARPREERPSQGGDRILCDFHMHTDHSGDCATPVRALVDRAVALGLGAIAVTDHNTIAGGVAAAADVAARGLDLHVIVGSEIKTTTGEVIGLYLTEEIPRGMPFADTVEAIHAQGGVVYVPHPFDRLHSICDPALLRRLVDEIDVIESCNARLYREAYNHEAAAFARRHGLLEGAGSDAHVLEGLGTAAVRLPRFDDAASLLIALGEGVIERRKVSVAYVQALKWVRQARKQRGGGES